LLRLVQYRLLGLNGLGSTLALPVARTDRLLRHFGF